VKEHSKTRLEIKIAVKSTFKRDMFGTHVKVKIPLPKNTAVCKIYTQSGRAKYTPEVDAIIWK
jgi:AP-2 complex subunit mu-1